MSKRLGTTLRTARVTHSRAVRIRNAARGRIVDYTYTYIDPQQQSQLRAGVLENGDLGNLLPVDRISEQFTQNVTSQAFRDFRIAGESSGTEL